MRTNKITLVAAVVLCMIASIAKGQPPASETADSANKPIATLEVADGDTFLFLGDSITYGCGWTQYMENYFITRFPDREVRFVNAAVGGDRSWWLTERFDKVVTPFRPRYATIMLGMNDGRYVPFDRGLYDRYVESMSAVIGRLRAMDTNVILMSPSHFDRRARVRVKEFGRHNYNGVLAMYGNWLREKAMDEGHGFVDINGPMASLIVRERKQDPEFALTTDGIHPDATGDMVIAAEVIRQMGLPREVSSIQIEFDASKWKPTATGGELTDFRATDERVTFTFKADSLPWVVPPEAANGYRLSRAGDLSREPFRVSGLAVGSYALMIDDNAVGTFAAADLAQGIDLNGNEQTPQHLQAVEVMKLNQKRNQHMALYTKCWFLWAIREGDRTWLASHGPGDSAGGATYEEIKARAEAAEEGLQTAAEALAKADAMLPVVYAKAAPRSHAYVLTRQ